MCVHKRGDEYCVSIVECKRSVLGSEYRPYEGPEESLQRSYPDKPANSVNWDLLLVIHSDGC